MSTNPPKTQDMKERGDNVVPFERPIPKPQGQEPPSHDWLSQLELGSLFLSKPKQGLIVVLEQYIIKGRSIQGNINLIQIQEPNPPLTFWVNPVTFCTTRDLVEVLMVLSFGKELEEDVIEQEEHIE